MDPDQSGRAAALLLAVLSTACPATPRTVAPKDVVRVVEGELDANKLLAAPAERAQHVGAGPLTAVGARIVTDGEQLGSFVEIPADDCALVLARGGKTVSDIDLFVYSDGGDRLASDEAPDARAAVMVCPPHPGRVYVVARSVSGEGMIALGVMRVSADVADAVSAAVSVRGRPGQDTGKLAQWPGLERMVRERRESLGSRWEDVRRVAVPLSPNAYTSVSIDVPGRRCVDLLVVPSEEAQGIDVVVVDDRGHTLARGKPPGTSRGFVLCAATAPQTVTLMVRPRVAAGLAAIIVGRSEQGAATDLVESIAVTGAAPIVSLDDALKRHATRTADLLMGESRTAGQGVAGLTRAAAVDVSLEAGCTRVDVVGGAPLGRFQTELWSLTGERLARAHGSEHGTSFVCGKQRKLQLEVRALDREGPFVVQTRHTSKVPAALLKHPAAASRLLARLDAAAGPVDVASGSGAREVSVRAGQRVTEALSVARGTCRDVVIALDEGARDVTLTLAASGKAATASAGLVATHQRVCAGPNDTAVTATISVAAGSSASLFLSRSASP